MHIYTFSIPLRSSILPFATREGLIVETSDGWGEASPLPGFSPETLMEAFQSFQTGSLTPSAAFALRCAHQPFPLSFPRLPVCALVTSWPEALQAVQDGYQTIKIKVKHYRIEDAIRLVRQLQELSVRLRIDANRCWNPSQAHVFFKSINTTHIEYIEEPVQNPMDLFSLPAMPIALDETLLEKDFERYLQLPHLNALILKPTMLGSRLDSLIAFGQKQGKKIVFSSSFESAVGLLHIAHLQSLYNPKIAVGLDTYRALLHHFLPITIENGMLKSDRLPPLDRTWLADPVF
ncbi:MAG: o-succinylbenzoate synthase [Parachlamydiales bacterium]|nr:o-succinylbenzoate synthase [Parachlamydiales bacterium]